jgi:competence protein CoiA
MERLRASERAEVTMERNGERHRADILLPGGTVVELQHSSIAPDEIEQREAFYGSMIWIFDITDCAAPCEGEPRFIPREKDGPHTFRWKHPRKHIAYTSKPTYLDLGTRLMELEDMYTDSPCAGWGYIKLRPEFMMRLHERAAG